MNGCSTTTHPLTTLSQNNILRKLVSILELCASTVRVFSSSNIRWFDRYSIEWLQVRYLIFRIFLGGPPLEAPQYGVGVPTGVSAASFNDMHNLIRKANEDQAAAMMNEGKAGKVSAPGQLSQSSSVDRGFSDQEHFAAELPTRQVEIEIENRIDGAGGGESAWRRRQQRRSPSDFVVHAFADDAEQCGQCVLRELSGMTSLRYLTKGTYWINDLTSQEKYQVMWELAGVTQFTLGKPSMHAGRGVKKTLMVEFFRASMR